MTWLIIFITGLFNPVEGYLDRFGEKRKGKVKDTVWLVIAAACLLGLAWWLFDIRPFWPALLIGVWSVTAFDYIAHAFLKRYSVGHKDINIWKFTGTTTYWWDQAVSKVDWRIRILVRVLVFATAVLAFLLI